jgi:hypothetical protein
MSMLRCEECSKAIDLPSDAWDDWLTLVHFLSFLQSEQLIEDRTFMDMTNKLMTFKKYAEDQSGHP